MLDPLLPHGSMRLRVQGSVLIAQPYHELARHSKPMLVDLSKGIITVSDKMMDMPSDYSTAHALVGVQRLKTCLAVVAVTACETVATVATHHIYRATATTVLTANGVTPSDKEDAKLLQLLRQAVDPLGSASGLYFSSTANVTLNQQRSHQADSSLPLWQRSHRDLWWNASLSAPLCEAGAHQYVTPFILGFVRQIPHFKVSAGMKNDTLSISIIARRAPARIGTRHWRRGADANGSVANFAETEQLVEAASGEMDSFVQFRGSIPISWSQVPNTRYKPPTEIGDEESTSAEPFRLHATSVTQQYGAVTAVNLVNQHGTEGKLSASFARLSAALPTSISFTLVTFDFHKECGATSYENLSKLWATVQAAFVQQESFRTRGELGRVRTQQSGAFRTNCVDCLDRTNVVQALFARRALERLLRSLLLLDREATMADEFPALEQRFKIMWADHGDMLSTQYAGTGALKSGFTRTGKRTIGGLLDDGVKSCVRYYLNNYEDGHKQDAYDLFTGAFTPNKDDSSAVMSGQASGAAWIVLSPVLALTALCLLTLVPFSERVTFVYHVVPLLAASVVLFAGVLALGRSVTCRPLLRPDLVQPWLPTARGNGAAKKTS